MRGLELGDEYADVLEPYASVRRTPADERPWVMGNMVCGIDGSTAVAGHVGALSTAEDAVLFRRLRSLADVVLVGAATVRNERYGPVRLDEDLRQTRRIAGRGAIPIAVVSRSLGFDWSAPLFAPSDAKPMIITCEAASEEALRIAAQHAEVVVAGRDSVDLRTALSRFRELGCGVVLCEGGATLLGELIVADLLDELCLTIAPMVGGDPIPVARASQVNGLTRYDLRHVGQDGNGALFLRYERLRDAT